MRGHGSCLGRRMRTALSRPGPPRPPAAHRSRHTGTNLYGNLQSGRITYLFPPHFDPLPRFSLHLPCAGTKPGHGSAHASASRPGLCIPGSRRSSIVLPPFQLHKKRLCAAEVPAAHRRRFLPLQDCFSSCTAAEEELLTWKSDVCMALSRCIILFITSISL